MTRIERRRKETRKRLLDAALDLFSRQGLFLTRVEEITEAADIGKGSFYEHFRAKDDLIRQLLHLGYEELIQGIESQIHPGDGLEARARTLLRGQWMFFSRNRKFFHFFQQVRGLLKLKVGGTDQIREEQVRLIERMVDLLLNPEERDRPLRRQEMTVVVCALAGCVSGHLSHRVVLDREMPGEEELQFLESILLPGLLNYHVEPVEKARAAS